MARPPAGRKCSFPSCGRPHDAGGYCSGHYRQHQQGKALRPIRARAPRHARACASCGHVFVPRSGDHDKCAPCRSVTDHDRVSALRAPAGKKWCKGCQKYKAKRYFKGSTSRCNTCRKPYERDLRAQRTYGLAPGRYQELYEEQGRVCYICRRANGSTKALSVDHDHSCCPGKTSCGKCVRGLLCGGCNYKILGHLRDSTEALQRAIDYLNDPPAQRAGLDRKPGES
jgi:hypothetical protein